MLGLKRGTVILCDHTPRWEKEATAIIERIKQVLGDTAVDVRHIGSTSVRNLKAKPIVDLAIGVRRLEDMDAFTESLSAIGVYKSSGQPFRGIVLFSRDDEKGNRVNNIQAMIYGSEQWNKHILFVEYLNAHPEKVSEYQHIKEQAIALYPEDVMAYSRHKSAFIEACIRDALHEWIR